jgi:quaternary ammonium compound-resistance protein SugE
MEAGVKISIDTDAHDEGALSLVKYGVSQARRAWVEKDRVINCMPLEDFERYLQEGKEDRGPSRRRSSGMTWILLFVAGLFEIGFALGLKYSEGFSRLLPTLGMIAAGGLSFYLLSNVMKTMPAGTAYAVWTGIGAAGTAVVGILLLGESASPLRVASLALIVAGVVGLRLA